MCKEGTVMVGMNVMANGQDPVAMRDDEYPEFVWEALEVSLDKD